MEAFIEIRKRAREKRDKAIDQARHEYAETLTRISALEQDLLGRDPSSHKTISSCINRVLPTDRTFTTVDVMCALEGLDPGKVWRKRSVDSHLSRLRERGVVRRVRKSKGTEPAIYARVGVKLEPLPFQGMTLVEVVAEVLGDQSMSQTELVVAMLEAGYDSVQTPAALRNHVGVVLRGDRKRFRRASGKWVLAR